MSLSSFALSDTEAMQLALAQARAAALHDDVPIGAVVVRDGVAVFLAPGGIPIWFDHDSVNRIIAATAGADA